VVGDGFVKGAGAARGEPTCCSACCWTVIDGRNLIPLEWIIFKNKKLFFKVDELKTVIYPDSGRGLYCQQLNKRDSQATVAEKYFFLPEHLGVYQCQSKYRLFFIL
jgi:hypothetical protein